MNATARTALVVAVIGVLVLVLVFGGPAMAGSGWHGRMMGTGMISGISWAWIPTLLTLAIGMLLGWALFHRR